MENRNDLIGKRISVPDPRGGTNIVGTCTYAQVNGLHVSSKLLLIECLFGQLTQKELKSLTIIKK